MQNETTLNGLGAYFINGQKYYRVSSILSGSADDKDKAGIQSWRDRVGDAEADKISLAATTRGTAVHKWAEDYCNGLQPVFDEPTALPFWAGVVPELDKITDVKYQETRVWHSGLKYAGTLDCYGTYDGVENTLIDFKTASKSKCFDWIQDYCIQTVAYAGGVKEVFGHGTNQAVIIIALPNKKAQVFKLDREEMFYYWSLWLKRIDKFQRLLDAA